MSQTQYQWIREFGKRMDSNLRSSLIHRLSVLRWIPCVMHRSAIRMIHRLSRLPVLVQLEDDAVVGSAWQQSLSNLHTPPDYYDSIRTYRMDLTPNQLQEILTYPEVRRAYLDRKVYTLLDVASKTVEAPLAWSLDNEGQGATIAVIDTGIHPHPDLTSPRSRILAFKDFVKGKNQPYDDNGHGTHCSGDAAGNGFSSDGKYKGPAPAAGLVGVKVLTKVGSGNLSNVIAGIQWCIDNREKYNIRIISLSLGSRSTTSYREDPVAQITEKAWEQGIVVVAAAGNDGPDAGTISSPGIHPRILTVGATDDKGTPEEADDIIAPFSSRGPTSDGINKPDLVAPGTAITSLRVKGSYIDKTSPDSQVGEHYCTLSGTSMATPIVAGLAAVLLTSHPDWTPDQVKKALIDSAHDMGRPPDEQGAGCVRLDRSLLD
ncbi:S8 family peptidase [Salinithrix halophila]|uniref:S8 family peptidase n=1 Tax=Salinithrix halophila TaxID=1485204 RepID=A0ABV8JEN8_9BACL